jgi:hypothetical protein
MWIENGQFAVEDREQLTVGGGRDDSVKAIGTIFIHCQLLTAYCF